MLAIVIIATITAFSISIFQQQAVNSQIDKTALQMQQWLEAAKAYYVDNGNWPDGNNFTGEGTGLSCTGQTIDPTILLLEGKCGPLAENNKIYIQSGISIENNAWGQTFQLLPPAGQTTENSAMFQVVSNIPGNLKNAYAIAERLASRLPNAVVNMMVLNEPITVSAGVTIPGSASTGGVLIQSLQSLSCDRTTSPCGTITKPTCPGNMTPNIYLNLQGFTAPGPGRKTSVIGQVELLALDTSDKKGWQVILNIEGPDGQVHQGNVLAVITCEASTAKNKNSVGFDFAY